MPIFQSIKFLGQVYNNLKSLFSWIKQGYRYYISFLEENIRLIDVKLLKYKDNVLITFKNYKALYKDESSYQLKIFYINKRRKYIRQFDNYFKENSITNKVIAAFLSG